LTVLDLTRSAWAGLSAFRKGWIDFAIYRFLTGLGVGGVFGLAVGSGRRHPPRHRPCRRAGTLEALSAVGNVTAGLVSMYMGHLEGLRSD